MFLLHGCQQFLPCVTLGNNKLVTKGVPCVCGTVGVGKAPLTVVPGDRELHSPSLAGKVNAQLKPELGGGVEGGGGGVGALQKTRKQIAKLILSEI